MSSAIMSPNPSQRSAMFGGVGDAPPPKKVRGSHGKKGKGRLKAEDVAEDKPELAAWLKTRRTIEERMNDAGQTNFYLNLVFQSQTQKQDFLSKLPIDVMVLWDMFVDGEQLALSLGIPIEPNKHGVLLSPLRKRLKYKAEIRREEDEM